MCGISATSEDAFSVEAALGHFASYFLSKHGYLIYRQLCTVCPAFMQVKLLCVAWLMLTESSCRSRRFGHVAGSGSRAALA